MQINSSSQEPTLVVGWDGSASSRAALAVAARLAHGGRIVAVHAHDDGPTEVTTHWQTLLRRDAAERSRALLSHVPPDVAATVDLRSAEGRPAAALERVADEVRADAIVVGSRGLGDASALMGSVSGALVRSAHRPVLVVPPNA